MSELNRELASKILSKELNDGRFDASKKPVTDEEYFRMWCKWYPDTFEAILRAMEEYSNQTNH